MWEKIKKWFGYADLNKDGKVTAEDLEVARAIAEQKVKDANDNINQRVARVKEEVADVVESANETIAQVDDIVAAVKNKPRKGRKKK